MITSYIKIFFIIIITIIAIISAIITLPINYHGQVFHFLSRIWSRAILFAGRVKITVEGLENVDKNKNYIYIANHSSQFDIPVVLAGLPFNIRLLAKRELTKIPLFGFALKSGGFIIVDRDKSMKAMQSLEQAAQKIKHGISVLLFAEGSRSMDGSIQPFKRGAFYLASKSGIPIIPLTIIGSHYVLPKKQLRIRSGTIKLVIDKPILTDHIKNRNDEIQLMETARNIIVKQYTS
jgi:1-acyl-sn-glycerol-3-phosphate acyltransferase